MGLHMRFRPVTKMHIWFRVSIQPGKRIPIGSTNDAISTIDDNSRDTGETVTETVSASFG